MRWTMLVVLGAMCGGMLVELPFVLHNLMRQKRRKEKRDGYAR